eukprot:GILJ01015257.1.p1 GENE.GILJ01015257.1~~GILJ01015257.1.p1  ORF type:complete len:1194 (+),score=144.45 GILJ01015257.1:235-3582(+)
MAFVKAFIGCMLSGMVPVPAYPPSLASFEQELVRLQRIVDDCGAKVVLSTTAYRRIFKTKMLHRRASACFNRKSSGRCRFVVHSSEKLCDNHDTEITYPKMDDVAFLQYTSGSTGNPKGCLVTYGALSTNIRLQLKLMPGLTLPFVGVSWLPQYHDMGLIGGILCTAYTQSTAYLISPRSFIADPMLWLKTISRFRATYTAVPNFALNLCVRKFDKSPLDLSCLQVLNCGAEPVSSRTFTTFCDLYIPHAAFRKDCFVPSYGLAEHVLIVSARLPTQPLVEANGQFAVGNVGSLLPEIRLKVINVETQCEITNTQQEGEIIICSSSCASGYYNKAELTRERFGFQPPVIGSASESAQSQYLRTGDLGRVDQFGNLFITGRIKDIIICRGRNYSPPDIEEAIQARIKSTELRHGCIAAVGIPSEEGESVAIVSEVSEKFLKQKKPDYITLATNVVSIIQSTVGATCESVTFIRPRSIAKTSSGKLQRHFIRQSLMEGKISELFRFVPEKHSAELNRELNGELIQQNRPDEAHPSQTDLDTPWDPNHILSWFVNQYSEILNIPESEVNLDVDINDYGLTSVAAVELVEKLNLFLKTEIKPAVLLGSHSLRDLAAKLSMIAEQSKFESLMNGVLIPQSDQIPTSVSSATANVDVACTKPSSSQIGNERVAWSHDTKICIIGGGPAGLYSAYVLQQKGFTNITVHEKSVVGGKTIGTPMTDGRFSSANMYIGNQKYERLARLAQKLNQPLFGRKVGHPQLTHAEQANFTALKAYIQLHYSDVLGTDYIGDTVKDLWKPIAVWLQDNGLMQSINDPFWVNFTAAGYGFMDQPIPAWYWLQILSMDERDWSFVVADGFKSLFLELWKRFSACHSNVRVRCPSTVSSVTRHADKITVLSSGLAREGEGGKEEEETYDLLIVALPLHEALSVFKHPSDGERQVLSCVEHTNYAVTVARLLQHRPVVVKSGVHLKTNTRKPVLLTPISDSADEVVFNIFYYVNSSDILCHTIDNNVIHQAVQSMFPAEEVEVCEVVGHHVWSYFPHVSDDCLRMGWLKQFNELQGKERTWYVGSGLGFETTEHVVSKAAAVIDRHFQISSITDNPTSSSSASGVVSLENVTLSL